MKHATHKWVGERRDGAPAYAPCDSPCVGASTQARFTSVMRRVWRLHSRRCGGHAFDFFFSPSIHVWFLLHSSHYKSRKVTNAMVLISVLFYCKRSFEAFLFLTYSLARSLAPTWSDLLVALSQIDFNFFLFSPKNRGLIFKVHPRLQRASKRDGLSTRSFKSFDLGVWYLIFAIAFAGV